MVGALAADRLREAYVFVFSSRRRHTRCLSGWSSDVCSSDVNGAQVRAGCGCHSFGQTYSSMITRSAAECSGSFGRPIAICNNTIAICDCCQEENGRVFSMGWNLVHSLSNSAGRERRPRANSPQESLYLFQSPTMALAISLAAERNQFDFLRPRSFKMPATWRLLPR